MTDLQHSSVMGGSSAERRINCPGSYELESEIPDGPSSEFADRGSMLHGAMELLLTADPETEEELEALLEELIGQDMGFEGHDMTPELIESKIRPALAAWDEIVEKYDIVDWVMEQRVSLDSVVPRAFGTCDIIAITSDGTLIILDWKFGDGVVVYVVGNMQLGFYAGGALCDDDPEVTDIVPQDATDEPLKVVLIIVQPRAADSGPDWNAWETTEEWVDQFLEQAEQAYNLITKGDAPLKMGDHCKWCKAKAVCPEQQGSALGALASKPVGDMTEIEIAANVHVARRALEWANAMIAFAQTQAEQGVAIPGFKLVAKRSQRKWLDEKKSEEFFKKTKRLKVDTMYNKKLKTPAQMEKAVPQIYKKSADEHVVWLSSGVTLIDESDKRAPVTDAMALLANALPPPEKGGAKTKAKTKTRTRTKKNE